MRGFSLLELIVALAIASILTTAALPNMTDYLTRERNKASVLALAALIQTARHAAIELSAPVTVCPGMGSRCGPRNSWHLGGMAFVDRNRNRRIDHDETRLAHLAPQPHSRVYWRSFRNRSYLRFTPRGITDWQNGHFLVCDLSGEAKRARQLVLNQTGRLYFSYDHDDDGVHENVQGKPLICP